MRPRSLSAQFAQLREQLGKIAWTVVEVNAEKVDDEILLWMSEQRDRFLNARLVLGVAQRHRILELGVVALRIDHAKLEASLQETLEKPGRDRRFTPARNSGDQQDFPAWRNLD